jgi:hypothetical protein
MAETLVDVIARQIPGVLEHLSGQLAGLVKAELSRAVTQAQEAARDAESARERAASEVAKLQAEAASLRKVLGKPA